MRIQCKKQKRVKIWEGRHANMNQEFYMLHMLDIKCYDIHELLEPLFINSGKASCLSWGSTLLSIWVHNVHISYVVPLVVKEVGQDNHKVVFEYSIKI